jgi:UDP-N-acetylmuramoyl-tripeptide--D-alanyl-D-alanine ligase
MKATVKWESEREKGLAKSNLIGKYNFENILAAITTGLFFGIPAVAIDMAIADYIPCNNRSQMHETNKNTLIKDFYNANPTSMALSIEDFAQNNTPNKCLILGDMLELGTDASTEHKKIIELISNYSFEAVYLIGNNFYDYKTEYPYCFFATVDDFNNYIIKHPEHSKLILIKGSRGLKLEKCIDYL